MTEPDFGPGVVVFDPSMTDIQARLDETFAAQEKSEFGDGRHAYLFKPGKYELDVHLGFYTQALGLGRSPDDVDITGAVRVKATWRKGNATCNFWRAAENLAVTPTLEGKVNVWAVSQGAAMRRVHVKGDLHLSDGGWSSGGVLADCRIDGRVDSGTQQQWISRNCDWGAWKGGNWNMVFVGVNDPPAPPPGPWPEKPYTVIDRTGRVREKPYLFIDEAGRYFVMAPGLREDGGRGTTWDANAPEALRAGETIPIETFHIARSDRDTAATINEALAAGKHLLLTPGIYPLDSALRVTRTKTIVLGIGYPTLRPRTGEAAVIVEDVPGVRLAGLLIDAGEKAAETLVQVGSAAGERGRGGGADWPVNDPISLHDIYCRAGGALPGSAKCMMRIGADGVIGDNLWLWRADHGAGAKWAINRNDHGLIVDGDDVTIYGLFVEHQHRYQTIWNGERGRVYFYQSEMPYDPPDASAWMNGDKVGFASYKVADHVREHEAWGVGVYCVFWDAPIVAETAIETPETPGVKMNHLVTIRLNGKPGSGIRHVINGRGDAVVTPEKKKANVK
jgi:hypothetical protein